MTVWVIRIVLPDDRDAFATLRSVIHDFPDCKIILSMEDVEK